MAALGVSFTRLPSLGGRRRHPRRCGGLLILLVCSNLVVVAVLLAMIHALGDEDVVAHEAAVHEGAAPEGAVAHTSPPTDLTPMQNGLLTFVHTVGAGAALSGWLQCSCFSLRLHSGRGCRLTRVRDQVATIAKLPPTTLLDAVGALEPLRSNASAQRRDGFVAAVRKPVERVKSLYASAAAGATPAGVDPAQLRCLRGALPLESAMRVLDCAALQKAEAGTRAGCLADVCPDCALSCLRLLDSAMTRQLGSVADAAAVDEPALLRAQRRLREQFAVVGVDERPAETGTILRAKFGWLQQPSCAFPRAWADGAAAGGGAPVTNSSLLAAAASAPSSPSALGAKALSALHRHSSFDTRLHAYAEELLSRALRELEAHERSGLRDGLRDSRRGAVTGSGRGSNADSERARAATNSAMAGSVAAASTGGGWKARLEARVAAPTTLAPSTDVRPIGSAEPDGDRGDGRSGRQRRRRRRGGGAEGNEEFARYQRREEAEEAATLRERQERLAAQCDDDGPWVVRSLPPGCADAPASNAAARGAHGDSESDANAVTDDAASALTRRVPCVRPATLLSCATLVDDAATCGRTLGDVLAAAGHNVSDLGSALPPDGTPLAFLCAARCFRAGAPSVANSSACKRWVARDDDALTSDDDPGFRGHGSDETGRPTPLARVSYK